jgi:poly-gamma-glutamate synthesis protein (capsule biosynthesis protein)
MVFQKWCMSCRGLPRRALWWAVAGALLALGACQAGQGRANSPLSPTPWATQAQPPPSGPRTVTIVAVGDIMLDRAVGKAIARRGPESILAAVRDRLRAADLTFGNLECPLSARGAHAPKDCVFRAAPATVRVLQEGGFDIVSLANNHTLNSGRRPFIDTMELLDRSGIRYCGGRREQARSWWPVYTQVGGLKIGWMAYTDLSVPHAADNKVAPDLSNLKRQVAWAARHCDLLVVSFHWGEEYQRRPSERQRRVARAAILSGADLVLGHHPHVLQGIAAWRGVPILYSMGNFVFDQRAGERMESALFKLQYTDGQGWTVQAYPVVISRMRFGPEYPPPERAAEIARRLQKLSQALGSYPSLAPDNSLYLQVRPPQPSGAAPQGGR